MAFNSKVQGTSADPERVEAPRADQVNSVLTWLRDTGSLETRMSMTRYAIPADHAFGVPVGVIRRYAKGIGSNHDLAASLWETGWYEARLLASFIDEPGRVTAEQMDHWCADFDSWAICDTVCFHLFDRAPHAWGRVRQWAQDPREFVKRGAFALLACLALHDKEADDALFLEGLLQVEEGAEDARNFVKKGVNWALRAIGERNETLNAAAVALAERLAEASEKAPRWIGKDALRQLASPAAIRRRATRQNSRVRPELVPALAAWKGEPAK